MSRVSLTVGSKGPKSSPELLVRIRELVDGLGIKTGHGLAGRLRWMGAKTTGPLVSQWFSGKRKISYQSLALLSLLHPAPARCFQWLLNGGTMPRLRVYPATAASLGLTPDTAPQRPLSGEGEEMLEVIARAVEYTIREEDLSYANVEVLTRSLYAMGQELEKAGVDSAHIWQAISFLRARALTHRREAKDQPPTDDPGNGPKGAA